MFDLLAAREVRNHHARLAVVGLDTAGSSLPSLGARAQIQNPGGGG